jgi:hypothetical protein
MVLLVCALAPTSLAGQRVAHVGGGVGLVSPTGSFGDVERTGWHVWGGAVGTLAGRFGFTVHTLYGEVAHENHVEGKTALAGGTVSVAWFLGSEERRIRPFLAAGAGGYRVNVDVPGFGSAATTKFAVEGGVGVLVGSRRRGFLWVRHVSVKTEPKTTAFLSVSAGVMLPLGKR